MRNPFKRYYYLSFERSDNEGMTISKHYRMLAAWFWVRPSAVMFSVRDSICHENKCEPEDVFLTAFNTN